MDILKYLNIFTNPVHIQITHPLKVNFQLLKLNGKLYFKLNANCLEHIMKAGLSQKVGGVHMIKKNKAYILGAGPTGLITAWKLLEANWDVVIFEKKKVSKSKIIEMEIKKTGKLFSFCCAVPIIIKRKNDKQIKFFENIGSNIGLLFQIADDLIDFKGSTVIAGKITGKDKKKGKATLISLLGYQNAIKYADKIKSKIIKDLNKYSSNTNSLNETLDYILKRNK